MRSGKPQKGNREEIMSKTDTILTAFRQKDYATAAAGIANVLEQKIAQALREAKQNVAATLLYPLAEGFRPGEKVVLAHCTVFGAYKAMKPNGQRQVVNIGDTGEYVRAIDNTWSVVWFPNFYESAEIKTADLVAVSRAHLSEDEIKVGDRIRTKKMGQTPGTVVKIENGQVHFELDEPESKFGKRVWSAPLSNIVKEATQKCVKCGKERTLDEDGLCHECWQDQKSAGQNESVKTYDVPFKTKSGKIVNRKVTVPPSNNESVAEETVVPQREVAISQFEVQRIYDKIGDVGEVELLCGITNLHVNAQGQVISYICEAARYGQGGVEASELGFPPGKWPNEFTYEGARYTRTQRISYSREGEIEDVTYIRVGPGHPRQFVVYND
jgi:hypothetical protein